ncbi:MAG TPA: cellulase family glycosylhydrolase [Verrucomicrobiae bacterium]|jgi:hypothetical protein
MKPFIRSILAGALILLVLTCLRVSSAPLERVAVSADRGGFVLAGSGAAFHPWGFNYDHDPDGRLLEDYWQGEWPMVERDFAAMKALGANVVRVHLQVGRFMISERKASGASLARLARLVKLAERTGLYLDVTGLGCYSRPDVPAWYNDLSEARRWDAQSRFWQAVAKTCARSSAIFCYDLMNEPVVSDGVKDRDWTPGEFAGKYFTQRLTLSLAGRTDKQAAKAWVDKMAAAVRKCDTTHLLTVGAIPWAMTWPAAKPLFYSPEVSGNLDFVSLHFYPKANEVDKALAALAVYKAGKPIVIEETFPLGCSMEELAQFIEGSRKTATGWIGFYWGETIAQYHEDKQKPYSARVAEWLEYFVKNANKMKGN